MFCWLRASLKDSLNKYCDVEVKKNTCLILKMAHLEILPQADHWTALTEQHKNQEPNTHS